MKHSAVTRMGSLIKWFTILVVWIYFPKHEKRVSCDAIKLHSSFWETTAKRKDYLHWQANCRNSAESRTSSPLTLGHFFLSRNHVSRTNPWLTGRETHGKSCRWMWPKSLKLTVGLRRWTCRRSRSAWRTRRAWRWRLWKAGGTRGGGGGTPSPGRSGLRFPSRCRPPSPAGCSANSACIQCSGGYSICKTLWPQ